MRDPRRAYRVVDAFEQELCDYTGAPYAVATNSCTNALLLAWTWRAKLYGAEKVAYLPRHTYVGVLQSALNAGYSISWNDSYPEWQSDGSYGTTTYVNVIDSARRIHRDVFGSQPSDGNIVCLSFHAAKQLPLGRGGAILTDNKDAAEWFRAARMDGRPPGAPIEATVFPGYHCPMPPDVAARGLDILSRWNDTGYTPPPLPPTDYPDLSLISHQSESSNSGPSFPESVTCP